MLPAKEDDEARQGSSTDTVRKPPEVSGFVQLLALLWRGLKHSDSPFEC